MISLRKPLGSFESPCMSTSGLSPLVAILVRFVWLLARNISFEWMRDSRGIHTRLYAFLITDSGDLLPLSGVYGWSSLWTKLVKDDLAHGP